MFSKSLITLTVLDTTHHQAKFYIFFCKSPPQYLSELLVSLTLAAHPWDASRLLRTPWRGRPDGCAGRFPDFLINLDFPLCTETSFRPFTYWIRCVCSFFYK